MRTFDHLIFNAIEVGNIKHNLLQYFQQDCVNPPTTSNFTGNINDTVQLCNDCVATLS